MGTCISGVFMTLLSRIAWVVYLIGQNTCYMTARKNPCVA
jgi:hypothetical protein